MCTWYVICDVSTWRLLSLSTTLALCLRNKQQISIPLDLSLGLSDHCLGSFVLVVLLLFVSLPSYFFLRDLSARHMLGVYFRSSLALPCIIVLL